MNPEGYGGESELLREQTKYAWSQKIGGLTGWVATLFQRNQASPAENIASERASYVAAYQAAKARRDTRGMRAAQAQAASLAILELRARRGW